MQEETASTWTDYKRIINDIRNKYELVPGNQRRNEILFRGQSNACHELLTTLERNIQSPMTLRQYLRLARNIANEIETYTEKKWNFPQPETIEKQLKQSDGTLLELPAYDYPVYLRHHGFPSPLLDWTLSPNIAAYFAFADANPDDAKKVAIFIYINHPEAMTAYWQTEPIIHVQLKPITTDKRHFLQKATYTVAAIFDPANHDYTFVKHDAIFSEGMSRLQKQDMLLKIEMPVSERLNVLRELDDFNINHFTLFQSEDSLVKALATREFVFGR